MVRDLSRRASAAYRICKIERSAHLRTSNYKDQPEDAIAWLGELGDPYVPSAADVDGRIAIDYGVYGAPETYLIDQSGTIRFKQIGPVTPDVWMKQILPLVQELNRQGNR